ncbi:baseplate J/gp47 family protein [Pectobacterium aroidearum]|uniref:baseplate J/gp47 family protein n=1 Tax=Pectobacterium aroidearum TaxID=1201031 RepID=UPI002FC913BC
MSELYSYIEETGVVVPDASDIKEGVETEFKGALGENMSTAPDTPQGRLISGEVSARRAVAVNNATLANQINPTLATGVFLESICALLGITRKSESPSVISGVLLTGIPLTEIPAGSRARSDSGDYFATTQRVVLDTSGRATVDFSSVELGAITCPAGGLITVVDAVLGWETVSNINAAVPGEARQSDIALRTQRQLRLARQGISTVEAQISGLYESDGVHSLAYLENISHEFATIDGIYMKPHSVWACVYGGADAEIAASLLKNKTDGAGWNGSVSVTVIEENAEIPYTVLFDRPTEVPITVVARVRKGQSSLNPATVVPDAMLQYAAGELDGERGFVVGGNVSPFELAGAVSMLQAGVFVQQVLISRDGETPDAREIDIVKNEIPTLTRENITVIMV